MAKQRVFLCRACNYFKSRALLNDRTIEVVTEFWAADIGCSADLLFARPVEIRAHGGTLSDYNGIFAMFRNGGATISVPPAQVHSVKTRLPGKPFSPEEFASSFSGVEGVVIGPAYIGYAEKVFHQTEGARLLREADIPASKALQSACGEVEWEHGGSLVGNGCSSGLFLDKQLVAMAGYEIWGSRIAHISVISHPDFRGRGFGRRVVSHVANTAIAAGLIPQYRTLESNHPSMRIAEKLGFCHFASSVSVRLGDDSGNQSAAL